jgi:hypothetical protein
MYTERKRQENAMILIPGGFGPVGLLVERLLAGYVYDITPALRRITAVRKDKDN